MGQYATDDAGQPHPPQDGGQEKGQRVDERLSAGAEQPDRDVRVDEAGEANGGEECHEGQHGCRMAGESRQEKFAEHRLKQNGERHAEEDRGAEDQRVQQPGGGGWRHDVPRRRSAGVPPSIPDGQLPGRS